MYEPRDSPRLPPIIPDLYAVNYFPCLSDGFIHYDEAKGKLVPAGSTVLLSTLANVHKISKARVSGVNYTVSIVKATLQWHLELLKEGTVN